MEFKLDAVETRVLGCLIEKELATPEYYPLTLNALINACNQKSNRNPVTEYDEEAVVRGLDSLRRKGLAMQAHGEGSRVAKYKHSLEGKLYLDPPELAVLGELLLRGPQTPGELRGRAQRMVSFEDLGEVERVLEELMTSEEPLAIRLPRQPGRKEHRFMHLMSGTPETDEIPTSEENLYPRQEETRISVVEEEIAALKRELADLRKEFSMFREQFE